MPGLTSKQVATFWREGFVAPLPALGPAEARGLRDWVETFERDHPHDRWAFNLKANLLFESVDQLVRDARFLDPVEDLIGPNLLISTATFRIKDASSPGYYGWHQDDRFIQMDPCWVLVFLAITECTVENGCLAVLPESHREPFMEAEFDPDDRHNALTRQPRIRNVDMDRVVRMELAAGEMGLFHSHVVHGSGANRSADRRIGLILDYFPAHGRQSAGHGSATLVRGRDDHGHFAPEPAPVGECTERNIQARQRGLVRLSEQRLLRGDSRRRQPGFPDRPAA